MTEVLPPEPIAGDFEGKDILSISQFDRSDVQRLFHEAEAMGRLDAAQEEDFEEPPYGSNLLQCKRLASVFYEPSSRTSSSFAAAAMALGGNVISVNDMDNFSSVAKGEDLEDTARTFEQYGHIIVLRHKEIGSAALAAAAIEKPLINAGDGVGEHPTQALLDLYTIHEERGHIDELNVTLMGDLKHGRTVHSLARLLSMYDAQLNYVSPASLAMPEDIVDELRYKGVTQYQTTELDEVLADTDVLYVTRVQKERFNDPAEYEKVEDSYIITPETMNRAPEEMILMHPLPRNGEISKQVDSDPRAKYIPQMKHGLHIRMGLLALVSGKTLLQQEKPAPNQLSFEEITPWAMAVGGGS